MDLTPARITTAIELGDASQVGAARRAAVLLGEAARLSPRRASDLSIIVTELGNNLVRHARGGQLLMDAGDDAVEVTAVDAGPGMDLEHCFRDGFSTGGTAGTGLGAVRRLASEFDAWSDGRGSVVHARVGAAAMAPLAVLHLPKPGEFDCGDQWGHWPDPEGATFAVCDGLGHGAQARAAALRALSAVRDRPDEPALALQAAHERCFGSRGSAGAVVRWRASDGQVRMAGVGNISTVLAGRAQSRGLASQNGTLGATLPRVHEQGATAEPGALLVMHSDGLSARWSLDPYPGLRARHPRIVAAVLYRDAGRQRDDATVLVARL